MPSPLLPLKITARDFPENLRTVVPAFLPRLLRPFREVFQAPSLTLELFFVQCDLPGELLKEVKYKTSNISFL